VYSFKNPRIGSICTRVRVKAGTPTHKKNKRENIEDKGQGEGADGDTNTQKDIRGHFRHA
jgi:hypothetical protein